MKSKEKYIGLLRKFAINYGKDYGIKRIGIFGSVARGADNGTSDIDIFYEGNPIGLLDSRDLKGHLESYMKRPIDLVRNHKYLSPIFLKHINSEVVYV